MARRTLPEATKQGILDGLKNGVKPVELAATFGVSVPTIYNYKKTLTVAETTEEQPFDGLVTVSVYFPESFTATFCCDNKKLFGPVQLNITPEVGELPERVTDVLVHVSVPLTPAVAPGVVTLLVTVTEPVAVEDGAIVAVT